MPHLLVAAAFCFLFGTRLHTTESPFTGPVARALESFLIITCHSLGVVLLVVGLAGFVG